MGSRKPLYLAAVCTFVLGYLVWNGGGFIKRVPTATGTSINKKRSSTPLKNSEEIPQVSNPAPDESENLEKRGDLEPHQAELASRMRAAGQAAAADFAFESWLETYGYSLSVGEMMAMLGSSEQTPARKARLFDFFLSESPEAYDYFHSKEGADFLENLLTNKATDPVMAKKIGRLLQWSNEERNSDYTDTYAQRLATSISTSEKTGLVAAIDDQKILRGVAFDHRQPGTVREAAIEGLLRQNREPGTIKDLLDLTDTQPELEQTVIRSAAIGCNSSDELSGVIAVLRKEGSATDANASAMGKALAGSYQYSWIRNVDPDGDPFLKKVLDTYREQSNLLYSARSPVTAP